MILSNIIVLGRCFGCSESFPHTSWMDGSARSGSFTHRCSSPSRTSATEHCGAGRASLGHWRDVPERGGRDRDGDPHTSHGPCFQTGSLGTIGRSVAAPDVEGESL